MSRKHHAIYSDPTGAATGAAPAKRRTTRTKSSESISEISSKDSMRTAALEPTVDRGAVARLAYSYWEARGFVGGSAEEDWLRAEKEIRTGQSTVG
jgi:hypothetical protein